MKKIFVLLFMISSAAGAQVPQYAPDRSKGQVVVTDVALRTKDFLQLPTANTLNPALGSYPDSNGRIWYNRFDSNLIVRNAGTYIRYFNSQRIMNMDANVLHLTGTETVTGAKTFNGNLTSAGITTVGNDIVWSNNTGFGLKGQDNVRYLSYTTSLGAVMPTLRIGGGTLIQPGAPIFTLVGKAWITDTLNAAGLIRPANDIIWANNSGFGLRGSDGVRFLYYTTALGPVATTFRVGGTTIQNGNPQFTVQGKAFITDSLNGANANFSGTIRTVKAIGGSSAPSVSLGANITGSVSVTGTDLAGTVTVTVTGASGLATLNELFTLTYSSAYSSTPHVVWSPSSANSAALIQAAGGLYLKNSGTSSFQIATVNSYTTPGSATYSFTYHVIQ